MSTLTVNTIDSKTVGSNFFQMNETITDDITIPSSKSSMIIGPVSINNLTINGHLNVVQTVDITNEINIIGTINFLG